MDLTLRCFTLIEMMEREKLSHPEPWKKALVQLACAVVSEVSISDYLRLLSEDQWIDPLNRLVTHTHRADELAHAGVFRSVGRIIFEKLNQEERRFFVAALRKPLQWFASSELDVWESILQQIGFPHAQEIIEDCRVNNDADITARDFAGLFGIADELDIDLRGVI